MREKLKIIWSGLIIISRDMFLGFILSIACAVVMYKINPKMYRAVGLLIPAGVFAGMMKGFAKYMLMSMNSGFNSAEYRLTYPKYKILLGWLVLLVLAMFYGYGAAPHLWLGAPVDFLKDNIILNTLSEIYWVALCIIVTVIGIAAHVLEP